MAQLVARLNGIQKVIGSNPISSTNIRGYSTVGSAIRSQRIGQGFESPYLHSQNHRSFGGLFFCNGQGENFSARLYREFYTVFSTTWIWHIFMVFNAAR